MIQDWPRCCERNRASIGYETWLSRHLGDPRLPLGKEAEQQIEVTVATVHRDHPHRSDTRPEGIVESEEAGLAAAVSAVEGGEVGDMESDGAQSGERLDECEGSLRRPVRRSERGREQGGS